MAGNGGIIGPTKVINTPSTKSTTFTETGTLTLESCQVTTASEILVVAGGGGGAGTNGNGQGGGGAGGYRTATCVSITNGMSITIGAGGAGGAAPAKNPGSVGNNSVFGPVTSAGGGYGAANATGGNGGGRNQAGGGSYSEVDEPHNPSLEHGHKNGGQGGFQYRFY